MPTLRLSRALITGAVGNYCRCLGAEFEMRGSFSTSSSPAVPSRSHPELWGELAALSLQHVTSSQHRVLPQTQCSPALHSWFITVMGTAVIKKCVSEAQCCVQMNFSSSLSVAGDFGRRTTLRKSVLVLPFLTAPLLAKLC